MKKKISAISIGIISIIVIAVTLSIFFMLDFEKTLVSWWALFFVLLSEIILFSGIWVTSLFRDLPNKVFIRSGLNSILLLYFFATVVTSLFSGMLKDNVNLFVIIEIVIIAISLIIITILLQFSIRINSTDQKIISDRKLMQICEKRIYDLLVESKNKGFETQLNNAYEKIKYCDKIGASSVDEKIVGSIMKLENQLKTTNIAENDIKSVFEDITSLLSQRNMEIADSKRGGF